jgi:hypothetical protein
VVLLVHIWAAMVARVGLTQPTGAEGLMAVVVVALKLQVILEKEESAQSELFGPVIPVHFLQLVSAHLNFGVENESLY